MILAAHHWLHPWAWAAPTWAGLTFLVLAATAFFALRQAHEARRLREAQARPFVIIDLHPWNTFIDLTIKNIGRTMARDVRFSFDPAVTTTLDSRREGNFAELNLLKDGIASLPPGKEITTLFDQFPDRLGQELPLTYTASVSYTGTTGERYSESIVLDLNMYIGTGSITRYGLDDMYRVLKEIRDSIKKWTDSAGLKVVTSEDQRERRDAMQRRYAEREARSASETENGSDTSGDAPK